MISFRNFLVFFGKKEISTAVFNESGDTSFLYNLTNDIGIYNKWAASVFDNWLFFVWSDKRVYWASINSAGNGIFDLQLEDITLNVMWHMDRLQEWDEVYMDSYSDRLYIFINWRHTTDSFYTGKTKILIYDKTYKQRLVHTLCWDVINWIRCGKFIWDDVYQYCWRDWDWDPWFGTWYDAVATAVLYRNNQNSWQDSSWITLDMFRRHKILNMIVLLARSRYSSDTYIDVTKYDKIASRYQYQMKEDEITEMWNDIRNCNEPRIPKCLTSSLSKCANTNNDCEWSGHNCEVKENDCCEKPRVFDDYCICYDDAGYEVSPIHKYKLTFNESYADYWKISLVSSWDNVAYFWGFMVGTETQSSFDADVDEFSTWECVQEKKCKQCTS